MNEMLRVFSEIDDELICMAIEKEAAYRKRRAILTAVKATGLTAAACLAVTFGVNKFNEWSQNRPPIEAPIEETSAAVSESASDVEQTVIPEDTIPEDAITEEALPAKMILEDSTSHYDYLFKDIFEDFTMEEFPDCKFTCYKDKITLDTVGGQDIIMSGDRVISVCIADLNDDNIRDICVIFRVNYRRTVKAYDAANDKVYNYVEKDKDIDYYEFKLIDGELYCDSYDSYFADKKMSEPEKLTISLFEEDSLREGIKAKIAASVVPTLTDAQTISATPLVDYNAIYAELGYDLGVDYTKDSMYLAWTSQDPVEYDTERGEGAYEELKSNNFMTQRVIRWCRQVDTDDADYVGFVDYGYGVELGSYVVPIYIKDDKIVRKEPTIEIKSVSIEGDDRDVFISCSDDYILRYELATGVMERIPSVGWSSIYGISDDYMLFGKGSCYIYDRHTKEVTEIPELNTLDFDHNIIRFTGDTVEYNIGDFGYIYHIDTGETEETEELYYGAENKAENERWLIKPTTLRKGWDRLKCRYITVTDKRSGTETTYDLGMLPEEYYLWRDRISVSLADFMLFGNNLVCNPGDAQLCVLNLETGEIAPLNKEGIGDYFSFAYLYRHNGQWYANEYGIYSIEFTFDTEL